MISQRRWRHLGALLVVLAVASGVAAQGFAPTSSVSGVASSSSTSIVHQATVILTNAQITHLPTTGITVASPGTGKLAILVTAVLRASITTPYVFNSGAQLYFTDPSDSLALSAKLDPAQVLGSSGDNQLQFLGLENVTYGDAGISTSLGAMGDSFYNGAMQLKIYDSGGNLSGGDPSQTLAVSVVYLILDLATGVFE